jgi:integrase
MLSAYSNGMRPQPAAISSSRAFFAPRFSSADSSSAKRFLVFSHAGRINSGLRNQQCSNASSTELSSTAGRGSSSQNLAREGRGWDSGQKAGSDLRQFASKFCDAIEIQCAEKPRTVEFYKAKVRFLLANEALASASLDAIDEAAIEAYKQKRCKFTSRRKKPLAVGSVNRELATLRRMIRLAHEWKLIQRVPRVRLLRGERQREFVLTFDKELVYLAATGQPLYDVAVLLLDTGLRLGETLSLEWPQVHLEPANGAKFGYLTVLYGKAKGKKSRNVPLSERVQSVLRSWTPQEQGYVFRHVNGGPLSETLLDQQHARVRDLLNLPADFVLHSLRHTFGTRLGESGADAFTIMKLMGHSTVMVSQRYVHPSPESVERAFEKLQALNLAATRNRVNGAAVTTVSTTMEQAVGPALQ